MAPLQVPGLSMGTVSPSGWVYSTEPGLNVEPLLLLPASFPLPLLLLLLLLPHATANATAVAVQLMANQGRNH